MFIRPIFQKPFESYERVCGASNKSVESIVNLIAATETRSSLYDLGEMIAEKQIQTYRISETSVLFRVNELYGAKLLHAKYDNDTEWSFITKFDCN